MHSDAFTPKKQKTSKNGKLFSFLTFINITKKKGLFYVR